MTAEPLQSLLSRVREATGPDREIDAEIDAALFGGVPAKACHDATRRSYGTGYVHRADDGSSISGGRNAQIFTGSIDVAIALAERVLPGMRKTLEEHEDGTWTAILRRKIDDGHATKFVVLQLAATPALAMVAATISALIAIAKEQTS